MILRCQTIYKKLCTRMFILDFKIISNWNDSLTIKFGMDKKIMAYLPNGMPLSIEKNDFLMSGMTWKNHKSITLAKSDRKWVLTVQSHLPKVLNKKQNKCVIALKNKGLPNYGLHRCDFFQHHLIMQLNKYMLFPGVIKYLNKMEYDKIFFGLLEKKKCSPLLS